MINNDEMLDYIYNESVFFSEHVDLDRLCRFYDEITKTQFLSWENKLFYGISCQDGHLLLRNIVFHWL